MISKPALEGEALRRGIRKVVGKHLDLNRYELFIFGSEAGGNGPSRSDVDVGLRGSDPVPGVTIQRIREELEALRTLRIFDVVDFARADESFKAIALQNVERL
jgi:predicted nucleotidyltransferase